MPAINPTNAGKIRSEYAGVKNLKLNIFPLTGVYATAEVLSTPSYPLDEVATTNETGTWSVQNDHMVRIYNSTETVLKYEGTVRKNSASGTLTLSRMQDGDTGIAKEVAQSIVAGDKIKIYDVFVPRTFLSFLDGTTFYKRSDLAYDATYTIGSRQTRYGTPQPQLGKHLHYEVDPVTNKAQFTLDASGSYDFTAGTLTYSWTLPTGISLVAPSVATDATITVEADAGHYFVACAITNGTTSFTRIGKRHIWITDGSTVKAFSDLYATKITSDETSREGRSLVVEVNTTHGDDLSAYLYTGAPMLLTYEHVFSNDAFVTDNTPTAGTLVENFYGYIRTFEQVSTDADGIDSYRVLVESPLLYFKALPIAQQTLIAKSTPTEWTHVHTSLSHIAYVVKYLMDFHGPMLTELHDYDYGDLDDFSSKAWTSNGGDLYTAVKTITARCLLANIGCKSDGTIMLRRHGSIEDTTWRTNNPTQWQWTDADILEEIGYTRNPIMQYGETRGGGFVSGTSNNPVAIYAIASVLAQSQGIGRNQIDTFIGASSNDIRDRVGNYHTWSNRPLQAFSFKARGNHDFTEPCLMEWQDMALTGYDPLETGVLEGDYRALPVSVSRDWEYTEQGVIKRLSVSCEPETQGKRAPLEPTTVFGATFNPTWCYDFDFTVDDFDWLTYTAFSGGATATYSAGVGWTSKDQQIFSGSAYRRSILIYKLFSARVVTQIDVTYNLTKGTFDVEPAFSIQAITSTLGAGTRFWLANSSSLSNGTGLVSSFTGSVNLQGFWITVSSSSRASALYNGSIVLKGLTVYGQGSNPFGSSNC